MGSNLELNILLRVETGSTPAIPLFITQPSDISAFYLRGCFISLKREFTFLTWSFRIASRSIKPLSRRNNVNSPSNPFLYKYPSKRPSEYRIKQGIKNLNIITSTGGVYWTYCCCCLPCNHFSNWTWVD